MNDHLNALKTRLANETARLDAATKPREIESRKVWVMAAQREIEREIEFLANRGIAVEPELTDDELLDALSA